MTEVDLRTDRLATGTGLVEAGDVVGRGLGEQVDLAAALHAPRTPSLERLVVYELMVASSADNAQALGE